jgi:hypothetical protein
VCDLAAARDDLGARIDWRTDMDQAWELELEFWKDAGEGSASGFYERHMITDGYVVLPSGVVSRNELISKWPQRGPVSSYELSEPRFTLIDGPNVIINYHVTMDVDWLPNYSANLTAFYTWQGAGWALAVRTHTPEAEFSF